MLLNSFACEQVFGSAARLELEQEQLLKKDTAAIYEEITTDETEKFKVTVFFFLHSQVSADLCTPERRGR